MSQINESGGLADVCIPILIFGLMLLGFHSFKVEDKLDLCLTSKGVDLSDIDPEFVPPVKVTRREIDPDVVSGYKWLLR